MEILELENTTASTQSSAPPLPQNTSLYGFNNRMEITEKRIRKPENKSIEIIQCEQKRVGKDGKVLNRDPETVGQ